MSSFIHNLLDYIQNQIEKRTHIDEIHHILLCWMVDKRPITQDILSQNVGITYEQRSHKFVPPTSNFFRFALLQTVTKNKIKKGGKAERGVGWGGPEMAQYWSGLTTDHF